MGVECRPIIPVVKGAELEAAERLAEFQAAMLGPSEVRMAAGYPGLMVAQQAGDWVVGLVA